MSAQGRMTTGEATHGQSTEQAIVELADELIQASIRRDQAALERLYPEDYIFTGSLGEVLNKQQLIASIVSGELSYDEVTSDDVALRTYGDIVVSTGRAIVKASYHGQDVSGPYRFTVVYAKPKGQWQPVAFHSSRIVQA